MQNHFEYYDFVGFQPAAAAPDGLASLSVDRGATALLIDFDGTYVDLAESPDRIKVTRTDKALLNELARRFDEAVAIVSGRNLDDVARHLDQFEGTISGGHGAELRHDGDILRQAEHDAERLEHIKRAVLELAVIDPRIIAEEKTFGIVLHFRQNPEVEGQVRGFVECLLAGDDVFEVQQAKMALEIKPKGVSKAGAIEKIMATDRFRGRTMLFAGDDETDESAFAYVNDHDGITIKIGEGPTVARYRADNPQAFKLWLRRQIGRYGG